MANLRVAGCYFRTKVCLQITFDAELATTNRIGAPGGASAEGIFIEKPVFTKDGF